NVGLQAMSSCHAADFENRTLPLRALDLTGCQQLTTGMLQPLGAYLQLERLKLGRTPLQTTDRTGVASCDNFEDLQRLHKLQVLELDSVRLDATACQHIARLPSLTTLSIGFAGDGVDDAALLHLSEAPRLEQLKLNVCDGFTRVGLDAFRGARPTCELQLPDRFR